MKHIATLVGWSIIGVFIAVVGQNIWNTYRTQHPETAAVAEQVVAETVGTTKDVVENVVEEAVVKAAETITDSKHDEITKPAPEPEPESATIPEEPEKVTEQQHVPQPAEDVEQETTDRLINLAEDKQDKPATVAKHETADQYQRRTEKIRRQEEVLIQRQVRIVDELFEN